MAVSSTFTFKMLSKIFTYIKTSSDNDKDARILTNSDAKKSF